MVTENHRALWMGMARIMTHLTKTVDRAVSGASGIGLTEMTMLGQIASLDDGARMVDLAERLQVSKAAVTKLTDGLERKGLAVRVTDENDRRSFLIQATGPGRRTLSAAAEAFEDELEEHFWKYVSDAEARQMVAVLHRVQDELGLPEGGVLPPRV